MVRQSNGSMNIESRLGAGTAVHLYLPRAIVETAAPEGVREAPPSPDIAGRILVVDDDPAVRQVSAEMLREAGYDVLEAESGHAALAALGRGEIYDVLVVDVAMPGLNGVETVRQARQRWPALRVLYITGYADLAGPDVQLGSEPVLQKPFRLNHLTAAVRDVMTRAHHEVGASVVQFEPLRRRTPG
jgi:CheY-like chemotaxis protein